jgi:hypothetical protein
MCVLFQIKDTEEQTLESNLLALLEDYRQAAKTNPNDRVTLHRFRSLCLELVKAKRMDDARLLAEEFRDRFVPLIEQSAFLAEHLAWLEWVIKLQHNLEELINAHFFNESYEPPEKLRGKLKVLGIYSEYRAAIANLIVDHLEADVDLEKCPASVLIAETFLYKVITKFWRCRETARRLQAWRMRWEKVRYKILLQSLNESGTSIESIEKVLDSYPFQNPFPTLMQELRGLDITIAQLKAAATEINVEKLDRDSATYFDPLRANLDALMLDMSEFSRRSLVAAMPLIESYYKALGELNRIIPSRAALDKAMITRRSFLS